VAKHGLFQSYYYAHHLGGDRLLRDRLKDHPGMRSAYVFASVGLLRATAATDLLAIHERSFDRL
jgi:hypothetical protein